jgi:hypothetical protein
VRCARGGRERKARGRAAEDGALREAVLLTRPGAEVGPAGRILLAWRRLAARPADHPLTEAGLALEAEEHDQP